jgi:hypothetical protein
MYTKAKLCLVQLKAQKYEYYMFVIYLEELRSVMSDYRHVAL